MYHVGFDFIILLIYLLETTFVTYMQVTVSNDKERHLCMWLKMKYLQFINGYKDLTCLSTVNGKYLTIRKKDKFLVLCEVQVFADLKTVNLAHKRPLAQREYLLVDTSDLSVDGDPLTCGIIKANPAEFAWLRVVLDNIYYITDIKCTFKKPKTNEWYIENPVHIYVSDNMEKYDERICAESSERDTIDSKEMSLSMKCRMPIPGRFVTIKKQSNENLDILVICEFEVYSRAFPHGMSNISSPDCLPHEYKCLEGRCIHKEWLCDGTYDCPLGDDEAPSCQGDKSQFKCKRINETINNDNRCDGTYNCPDKSDEELCFEMYTRPITATFKGESNMHICMDNWDVKYSIEICQQHDRDHTSTQYFSSHEPSKFLKINKHRIVSNATGFMTLFDKSYSCQSKKIVHIECAHKPDWTYSCGKRYLPDAIFEPYIVKGQTSKEGAWPWYVQLFRYTGWFYQTTICGGSLIARNWVLTAAHCVDTIRGVDDIYVKIGSTVYDDYYRERFYASHVIIHPQYNRDTSDNLYDVALIRLKSKVIYNRQVRSICLPVKPMDKKELLAFKHCIVVGFGDAKRDGGHSHLIQQARMNFIDSGKCTIYLDSLLPIKIPYDIANYNSFCGGPFPLVSGPNICSGDSGSPWMCKAPNGIWTQIGIAHGFYHHRGTICSSSIFIPVGHYLDFIHSTMSGNYTSSFGRIFMTHFDVIPYPILATMIKCVWF